MPATQACESTPFFGRLCAGVSGGCRSRGPPHFSDSLVKQPRAKLRRPVSLRRRVAPSPSLPSGCEGMARQGALPSSVSVRISLRRCGSASRRATRASCNARAHLRSSWCRFARGRRRNHSAPGRALRFGAVSCRSCPAVPWPLVSSQEPAGRAGRRHTPQPSASSWRAARIGRRAEPRRRPSAWEERSSPARGRRIRLHHQTPLDDAPRRAGPHVTTIL
jgi:hypothetical protein